MHSRLLINGHDVKAVLGHLWEVEMAKVHDPLYLGNLEVSMVDGSETNVEDDPKDDV